MMVGRCIRSQSAKPIWACVVRRSDLPRMTDLESSHSQLQAALALADKEICKLNFGKRETPLLAIIRRVQRDAREAAKRSPSWPLRLG
jgi:hypothetical protein